LTAPLTTAQVAGLLESTCSLIESEIRALGDEEARWHPAPGEWCVNEVLGHMTRILESDRPREDPWDQIAVAKERADCQRVAMSLFTELMGLRRTSVELVRGLRPDQLDRSCIHGKVGELRVRDLLHEWVHHDRNHTRQLLANVQERAWPYMANAQKFKGE